MEPAEAFEAQLRQGRELAPSFVGLHRDAAVRQVAERGYRAETVPATVDAVTADLDSRRIRLFLDEHDMVVRATAG